MNLSAFGLPFATLPAFVAGGWLDKGVEGLPRRRQGAGVQRSKQAGELGLCQPHPRPHPLPQPSALCQQKSYRKETAVNNSYEDYANSTPYPMQRFSYELFNLNIPTNLQGMTGKGQM